MGTESELKPCPFCGGEAYVVWDLYRSNAQVLCNKCFCRTPKAYYGKRSNFVKGGLHFKKFKTDDEARAFVVETWNRRGYTNESLQAH